MNLDTPVVNYARSGDVSRLARYSGREIRSTGDGFFAAFDGPARAIACAHKTVSAAGSGIDFEDRGDHTLKGVPGKPGLFAARLSERARIG
jgi:hypothetical protein